MLVLTSNSFVKAHDICLGYSKKIIEVGIMAIVVTASKKLIPFINLYCLGRVKNFLSKSKQRFS